MNVCGNAMLMTVVGLISLLPTTADAKRKQQPQVTMEVLSESPRIYLYHNFLSDKECTHLMALAKPKLVRSEVVDDEGVVSVSEFRTSEGMFIETTKDPVVNRIEKRISRLTNIPKENSESMQVLRYGVDQEFRPHHDYLQDEQVDGNNRQATFLMYLNTIDHGGETIFPLIDLKVKPVKGDALLFYNYDAENKPDELTLHQGAPVLQDEKWSATSWLHFSQYR